MDIILEHLVNVFLEVRDYLLRSQDRRKVVGKNPKGDVTREFDFEAEKIVINYLLKHFPTSRILTEELGMVNESLKDYDYLFVVDPVDGSVNFANGIPLTGFSIAVLEKGMISTDRVTHAIVGQIYSGAYFTAKKGGGAYLRDRPIQTNPDVSFEKSIVTCSLNHFAPEHFLLFQGVNKTFKQIRSFASSSIELSYLIQGITGAHYDFRKSVTAENFLAPALILSEMGGKLSDLYGNPVSNIENLTDGYSIVASHNAKDHRRYLDILKNPDLYG
ncbi:MAG: fructose 1,6-bisphosphatase [bacterium]|nr:MAG: fructose 1,6-bisphosphatase [bacterium]